MGPVAEHLLHLLGGVAGLRRVGLVDDDGVATRRQLLDVLHHVGELLDGGDDDPRPLPRAPRRVAWSPGRSWRRRRGWAAQLVDRLLELPVDEAVGDHDDLVEHRTVVRGVQRRQPVGQPGDRVRLARPRRVLHEVRLPGALRAGVGDERQHGAPLVVGEKRDLLAGLVGGGEHEPGEQVEPGIARPHLLPTDRRCGSRRIKQVPGPVAVAPVERQEPGAVARQASGHEHLLGVDSEVHDRSAQKRITAGSDRGGTAAWRLRPSGR